MLWVAGMVVLAFSVSADLPDNLMRVKLEASAPGTGAIGRAAAVEKAQEDALVQVIKSYTTTEDLRPFRAILDRPERYITSCQVVEQKQSGASTHVEVEAFIQDDQLRVDLAKLLLPMFPQVPKVVIVVMDGLAQDGEDQIPQAIAAEEDLIAAFKEAGFDVVDPAEVHRHCKGPLLVKRVQGEPSEAVKFAREFSADVAVVGEVIVAAPPALPGSNLRASRATLTLRVIRGEDAKIIDLRTAEAVVKSQNPADAAAMAIADACAKVKHEALVSAVLGVASAKPSDNILITVDNIRTPAQWEALCSTVGGQPGVAAVEQLYFSDGSGRLRVVYDGPVAAFVDAVTAGTYAGGRLEPHKIVNRNMMLDFVGP